MNQNKIDARQEELEAAVETMRCRLDDLEVQVELLRVGADDTPAEEGAMLTPGQWIHMFLEKSGPDRLLIVETIFLTIEVAKTCRFTHRQGD